MKDVRADLAEHLLVLGNGELRVLESIAARLRIGQRQYGLLNLEAERRDFIKETLEEMLDGVVYASCYLLKK